MYYFIFPDADTTLYQHTGSKNTGLDEIVEIRKDLNASGENPKVSRILMKFDIADCTLAISIIDMSSPLGGINQ